MPAPARAAGAALKKLAEHPGRHGDTVRKIRTTTPGRRNIRCSRKQPNAGGQHREPHRHLEPSIHGPGLGRKRSHFGFQLSTTYGNARPSATVTKSVGSRRGLREGEPKRRREERPRARRGQHRGKYTVEKAPPPPPGLPPSRPQRRSNQASPQIVQTNSRHQQDEHGQQHDELRVGHLHAPTGQCPRFSRRSPRLPARGTTQPPPAVKQPEQSHAPRRLLLWLTKPRIFREITGRTHGITSISARRETRRTASAKATGRQRAWVVPSSFRRRRM
ncbi:MAG: hypothetical protein CM1200mP34_3570 [Verrucomicrobiales bacterium]|nr:MAG: hypothetical protein CM1200mP34_3570 [Verrucomicrobiales bacterium]